MNKNIIGIIILICIIIVAVFFFLNNKNFNKEDRNNNQSNINDENNNQSNINDENNNQSNINDENNMSTSNDKKVLVVYFSATNNTKNVAEKIAANLNGDLFEIEPKDEYTSNDLDWTNENSRVSREHNDESLRNIELKTTKIDNWDSYDIVLIGYPIWWGIAAWPVNNFVKDNDFTGKTVIPFCTSASSSLGNSDKLLEELAGTGNWESGHRFSSSASDSDIKSFTDSIK